jgi:hypothetical protein
MACAGCKERARLIGKAVTAFRTKDIDSVRDNLQMIATSLGQDVKTLATTFRINLPTKPPKLPPKRGLR